MTFLKPTDLEENLIKLLENSHTKWTTPEWGIPKGRKHNKESDINCAIREFVEESGIKHKNLNIYRNVKPLEEKSLELSEEQLKEMEEYYSKLSLEDPKLD